jgi:transcriptional regulator with XRE-family HTH domain
MTGDRSQENVLADRLERLFRTVHPAGRRPYSLREVAAAINDTAGETIISATYLSQLRSGQRTEPSHSRLVAIARFFGVGVDYFSDAIPAEDASRQAEVAAAMRNAGIRQLALRAHGLSDSSLAAVLAVIDNARRLEKLPDPDDQPGQ